MKMNGIRLVPLLGNVHLVFHSIIKVLHLLCSVHIYQRLIKLIMYATEFNALQAMRAMGVARRQAMALQRSGRAIDKQHTLQKRVLSMRGN